MTTATVKSRPSAGARRFGYGVAAAINIVLLYLINVRPGWDVVPFLTADTSQIIPLVNASLLAGLVVDGIQSVRDPRWLVALGGLVTTSIGVAVLVRTWQVFPFDFGDAGFNWALLFRFGLVVAVAGALIGFVVQAVTLGRELHRAGSSVRR
ncbi:hypothetical protein BJY16_006296 [Actinoplanes octamycinicus]|uniref:Uncharacterized protein n=1 Tax=Actinoplanes octamycinicus TaxID=135948 RepID=A0A7W7H379_9ACTN|nr:hypothetical protein [Actinoplanes octamycinicus]MBB4742837.1 hypothetical protein [Actinoplanes octamycinicus]GIE58310.1 hypothetical protein Aoc01nite_37120 [Actinoplanes octamycinicus]